MFDFFKKREYPLSDNQLAQKEGYNSINHKIVDYAIRQWDYKKNMVSGIAGTVPLNEVPAYTTYLEKRNEYLSKKIDLSKTSKKKTK